MDLNPISQLDPVVIVGVAVVFLATFLVLRRVFVLPYLEVMERREALVARSEARLAEAESTLRSADFDAERIIAEAAASAEQRVADAKGAADAYRRETVGAATKVAAHRLESGRAAIAAAREAEVAQLRGQAVDCAGLACRQLLGEPDPTAVEAAVDRLMSRRVH